MAKPPVTLADIARRLGVHKVTVHRALAGTGRISDELRERIQALAAKLGYDADLNASARRLSLAKQGRALPSRAIALVMPRGFYRTPYFVRLFQGVMDELTEAKHSLHCFASDDDPRTLAGGIARAAIDGALIASDPAPAQALADGLRGLRAFADKPIVSLINIIAGAPSVTADYHAGGRMLAGHLLDLGHRHLLHFFGGRPGKPLPDQGNEIEDRLAGMRAAYRDRGLDPAKLLHGTFIDWTLPKAQRLPDAIERHPQATALLASHDPMALELIAALAAQGRSVPGEVSVAGFDDSEPASVADAAKLTTVALPLEAIAREAARLLLGLAAGGDPPRQPSLHPVRLVARGSTAAPR